MDDRLRLLLGKNRLHRLPVLNIRLIKGDFAASQLLSPLYRLRAAVIIIINHNYLIAALQKLHCRMGTDISGTPCQ